MKISKEEYQAFLRRDPVAFAQRSFYELNPQTEFMPNGHIEVIAEALEKCRLGKIRRLIINLPPRSLKSHLVSIAFPAYLLGHNPATQIICASYGQDLADKLAADSKALINTGWYQGAFPGTRLAMGKQGTSDFSTTRRGFRLSTSVGGVLTGRGGGFIIIDDPSKPEEALSETLRNKVNEWFDHTLISRLNDKQRGCIIVVMQRLHEDDLVGHLLRQGGWQLLKFPAVAERDESFKIQAPYGRKTFSRQAGEALHPDRESLETLSRIREIQGEYNFAGQFQQAPSPLGGGMIKIRWFKTYTLEELPIKFEFVFQSWDTASKAGELNDYSVCSTWGVSKGHLYLIHVWRQRVEYPDLKRAVKQQAQLYEPKNIIIEDKASGIQLIQDLRADRVHATTPYQNSTDKVTRMYTATSMIETGFVHIPVQADWLAEYQHEMAIFPNGKYDDQIDSTSQALDWFKNGTNSSWICEFASEFKNAQNAPVAEAAKCGLCGIPALSRCGVAGVSGDVEEQCRGCGWSRIIPGKTTVRSAPTFVAPTFSNNSAR